MKVLGTKSALLSGAILLSTLVGGYVLLTSLTTTRWGEYFPAHDIDQTLPVSPTFSYTQTLKAEYGQVLDILLNVAEPSPESRILLDVRSKDKAQSINISLADALESGELYVPLPQPFFVGQGQPLELTISHISGPQTNLRFQINNRPRPEGELTRFNRDTQLTQQHNGNIAFHIQYNATLADQTGLTLPWYFILAASAILAWVLYLRYQRTPSFLPPIHWQRRDYYLIAILVVLIMAVFLNQLAPSLDHLPVQHDFTKDTLYLNSAVQALRNGTIPYWQHSTCGGQPLLGNPETNIVSLGTIISQVTGPTVGLKLMIVLEAGLMAAGAYVLGRSFGLSPIGAVVPALVLPLSGYVVNRVFLGHTNYIGGLAYLPWAAFAYLQALQRRRWLLVTATILALMLFRGDTHSPAYLLILLGIWSVWFAFKYRTTNPLRALYIVVVLFFLISLPKILPILSSSEHFRNDLPQLYAPLLQLEIFSDVFFDDSEERYPVNLVNGEDESWENIGLHVGQLAFALSLIGLIVVPGSTALLLGASIAIFLILGEGTLYDQLLRHIPIVGSVLRLPSRLMIMAILAGSLSAGFFIDRLTKHHLWLGGSAALLLLYLLFTDMSSYARELIGRTQFIPPVPVTSQDIPQTRSYDQLDPQRHTLTLVDSGHTVPGLCLDFNQEPPFNTDVDTALVTDSKGNPLASTLTPNQLTIIDPPRSDKLYVRVVNSPLLSVTGGYHLTSNNENLLLIVATDSEQPIKLTYQSRSFWPGTLLALGTIAATLTAPRPPRRSTKAITHSHTQ